MTRRMPIAFGLTVALALAAKPATAQDDEELLTPNPHGGFLMIAFGPALGLTGCRPAGLVEASEEPGCSQENSFTQIKLGQDFGWHLSNDGEGFALGVGVEEAFLSDIIRISPGVKAWWDFLVRDEWGLYLSPMLKVGYAGYTNADPVVNFFNAQLGLMGKVVFDHRWVAYLRPVTVDMVANGDGLGFTYDLALGAGVAF